MGPTTISGINNLRMETKREIYTRLIPSDLILKFDLPSNLTDPEGNDLVKLKCKPGSSDVEMELRHQVDFQDPILYGHITDTVYGQIHVLLYILNDPDSPRFDVDKMPDGTKTMFGLQQRNIKSEIEAMEYGLAPGQVRKGFRLLESAIIGFEHFVDSLGHDLYFAEPLFYHNAYIFERYGFAYSKGTRFMERIQKGFAEGGDLLPRLDGSNLFRQPESANSIRLRSWAIHDGILDGKFTNVTMYKRISQKANENTSIDCPW
jgi:hypothetical protein